MSLAMRNLVLAQKRAEELEAKGKRGPGMIRGGSWRMVKRTTDAAGRTKGNRKRRLNNISSYLLTRHTRGTYSAAMQGQGGKRRKFRTGRYF